MDLSPTKLEILETLLLHEETVKAVQVAKELSKKFPAVQMHLIGLVKMRYAASPKKGHYVITEEGKKALGLPEVTKENALTILAKVPREKTFHFYVGIGKPLHVFAHDLSGFCDKVGKVDAESLEFHVSRGDFEAWFKSIGDEELTRKTALLKQKKLSKEELRSKLHEIVETRCMRLSKKVE